MHMNNKYLRPLKAKNLDSLYSKYMDCIGNLGYRKPSNISITPLRPPICLKIYKG